MLGALHESRIEMTITELRHVLQGLENEGHGRLTVFHLEDTKNPIEGVQLVQDVEPQIALLY